MQFSFIKCHGLGNDFIVIDRRGQNVEINSEIVKRMADRRFGIGCDQVVLIENSEIADAKMRIFNADGGEVASCGNATRCIGWLVMIEKNADSVNIESAGGMLKAVRSGDSEVSVDMGEPRLEWLDIPLAHKEDTLNLSISVSGLGHPVAVSMGNPHTIFFVDDPDSLDIQEIGSQVEHALLFPERTNVEFAKVIDRGNIKLRVWERGAGETLACGTGACATLVAAVRRGLTDRKARVSLPGGDLKIEWAEDNHVIMTGAVSLVFEGTANLKDFS